MIGKASATNYNELLQVWERSVRATHYFLREEDIEFYRPLILQEYFDQVELFCHTSNGQDIDGFIGIAGDKVEMLFIDAAARGKGIGRKLLLYAQEHRQVKKVDVNEQNTQAVGFYERMGYRVAGRSEVDGGGKPYPLLFLERG